MAVDILVPPLSQTMDTLILVEWVKQVGEPVNKGETLFRVETDKATLEVESPASGVLQAVLAQPGDEIKIRTSIGTIAEPGDLPTPAFSERPGFPQDANPSRVRVLPATATGPLGEPLPPDRLSRIFASPRARQLASQRGIPLAGLQGMGSGPQDMIVERDVIAYLEREKARPKATPVAQRMAETAGIDLETVTPARPGGTITKADVTANLQEREPAAPAVPPAGLPAPPAAPFAPRSELEPPLLTGQKVPLSPTRQTIARRMLESRSASAPVTYLSEVDATRLVRLRERLLKRLLKSLPEDSARPTFTDFLVFILCQVLPRHPDLNATFEGEALVRHGPVHLALAVDTERGLLVPVIREAQGMGVVELARARADLVERAHQGKLTPEELSGGTFTLSNLGPLGVDHFTPVINPPQVAILGAGRIRPAPAVHKGKLRIRYLMGLSVTCDHRFIDGAPAARFLRDVCSLVENPDLIWM